jgi:endogenous inhibitor of DNA gyrase (YacG/DUF329 family)
MEQDYDKMAKTSWSCSASKPFCQKAKYLAVDLKRWCKNKPRLSNQTATVEDQILQQQTKPPINRTFISNITSLSSTMIF